MDELSSSYDSYPREAKPGQEGKLSFLSQSEDKKNSGQKETLIFIYFQGVVLRGPEVELTQSMMSSPKNSLPFEKNILT